MFDMGFLELMMIAIVGLIVMGPEKLPSAIRTVMMLTQKVRRAVDGLRYELEREVGADELRQQIKNHEITKSIDEARNSIESEVNNIHKQTQHMQQQMKEELLQESQSIEPQVEQSINNTTPESPKQNT